MEFSVLIDNEILFGNGILESLHDFDHFLGWLFSSLTFIAHYLGSNIFFMGILAFSYILYQPRLGRVLAVGLLSAGIWNSLTKYLGKSPRPSGLDESIFHLKGSAGEYAFGFPSGHVHSSVVVWGILFALVPNRWVRLLSVFVIMYMPFARMYMGVHYLGDVLGGLVLGGLNLFLVLEFFKRFPNFPNLEKYEKNYRVARTYILAILALSLSPVLLLEKQMSLPEIHSLTVTVNASAALAGFLIGLILLKIGRFREQLFWGDFFSGNGSPVSTLLVRVSSVVLGISIFYFLPGYIFSQFSWGSDILIRYLRYLMVGFFIVYLIPTFLYSFQSGVYIKRSDVKN